MLEGILLNICDLKTEIDKIYELLNPNSVEKQIALLEKELNETNWNIIEKVKEHRRLTVLLNKWGQLYSKWTYIKEIGELAVAAQETDLADELEAEYQVLRQLTKDTLLELMFTEQYDTHDVILTIHAGAGGKEAQDWANMLFRMYSLWASKHDFKCNVLDYQTGDDSTVCKSATIEIIGDNAYGLLKNENGVHRLVRVSPFDSQNRRHTSFAAVEVMPEITPDMEVNIDPKDLQVDTYRASGAGGQHVNKTESAVRITHKPSGIVVACQNERSQHQNKEVAMKMLLSKLVALKEEAHLNEISEIQGEQKQIQWGSQIRSYVFMPYQLVKDHRTDCQSGAINSVMNGDIDEFIFSSLVK